ncbi:hypothetical protein LCGC14_0818850, partial [marine sediment metagenome]
LSRPIQHEFIQQELYEFLRDNGYDTYFEYYQEYYHKFRGTRQQGKTRLIENGRVDIYAIKDIEAIAIEFDSGATLKWKSIEKLLQSNAQYCFGIVSGAKSDNPIKLDMYDEKTLWKWRLCLEEHLLLYDEQKEFSKLYSLLNKKFWIGNIKKKSLVLINPLEIITSKITLKNLKAKSKAIVDKFPKEVIKVKEKGKLTKNIIVIFQLENNKWYIGQTNDLESYVKRIKRGYGPPWIQIHKYVSVYKTIKNSDLKTVTLNYMKKLGWQNVRGYAWRQINMKRPPIALREGKLKHAVSSEKFDDTVYILKLEQEKWFLGKCLDEYIDKRIERYVNGKVNPWIKTYRVIDIHKLIKNGDLKTLTLEYMRKYGWENVRGHSWITKDMKKPPKELRDFILR